MNPDDDMLMAYLDGELDELRRHRIERALEEDEALRARLESQRRLRDRLAAHYGPVMDEEVPERFRRLLDTNVVQLSSPRAPRAPALWQSAAALAATLVVGLVLGSRLGGDQGPAGFEGGTMIARGELAEALETRLASAQAADSATRIGVTFARADGTLCRTFATAATDGLACRGEDGWRLVMTASGEGSTASEYRQAGSASSLVLAAAQEMMAGEPLDAAAEARARDSGWRPAPPAD